MRHIEIQYYGPTSTKPSRLALKTHRPTVFLSRTIEQTADEQARAVMEEYAGAQGYSLVAFAQDRRNPDKWHGIIGWQ